ncbi:hypothetical protein ACFOY2_49510 [Nonomuraea purpurea]|uniref:Uncharacterized protein n=1 Tax=Nonomuraea purpurea TaxID=1849276 RepID=A0ABV8GSM2_9ACTN
MIGGFPPRQIGRRLRHRLDDLPRFGERELRLFSTTTTFGTPMDITLDEVAIESY